MFQHNTLWHLYVDWNALPFGNHLGIKLSFIFQLYVRTLTHYFMPKLTYTAIYTFSFNFFFYYLSWYWNTLPWECSAFTYVATPLTGLITIDIKVFQNEDGYQMEECYRTIDVFMSQEYYKCHSRLGLWCDSIHFGIMMSRI